jgi:uncharacterized membrane protein
MTGFEIGLISIVAMLLLIYIGMHVPVCWRVGHQGQY